MKDYFLGISEYLKMQLQHYTLNVMLVNTTRKRLARGNNDHTMVKYESTRSSNIAYAYNDLAVRLFVTTIWQKKKNNKKQQ